MKLVQILSFMFLLTFSLSVVTAAEFEKTPEQFCIKNDLKGHSPYVCFLRLQEGNFVAFDAKSEIEYYLKKLQLDWTFHVVSKSEYFARVKSQVTETYVYQWSEQTSNFGLMKCVSGLVIKFLEGAIPLATAAATPSFTFGSLVGGVGGFALVSAGGASVVTAPHALLIGSGVGGAVIGGLAGIGGFIAGGTKMLTQVLSNPEEKSKICGMVRFYSLLPENTTSTVSIGF